MTTTKPDSLYIHIPFCVKKCSYCDFLSLPSNKENHELYISYLNKEIALYQPDFLDTIYIGGGTPSVIEPSLIGSILSGLSFSDESEITIEVNPGTASYDKFLSYKSLRINRVSIGCQSFNDSTLKLLGRIHDKEAIYSTFEECRKSGFNNINLDLIFSVPGQTMEMLAYDLESITALNPEHISIYSLIWEEGTPFYNMLVEKKYSITNDDIEGEMYSFIIDFLEKKGYIHYEVSNFAKPGFESRHNTKYWLNKKYFGCGLGASGYIDNIRYKNYSTFNEYYSALENSITPIEEEEILDLKSIFEYSLILGLRLLKDGISFEWMKEFYPEYEDYLKIAENLIKEGFLSTKNGRFFLSSSGLPVANEIFIKFLI